MMWNCKIKSFIDMLRIFGKMIVRIYIFVYDYK